MSYILPQQPTALAYIYILIDPRSTLPFYIGRTEHPDSRLYGHVEDGRKYNILDDGTKRGIIKSILTNNLMPLMRIIEVTTPKYQAAREYQWWQGFRDRGYRIVNVVAKPGDYGMEADEESDELSIEDIYNKLESVERRKSRFFLMTVLMKLVEPEELTPEIISAMKGYVRKGR